MHLCIVVSGTLDKRTGCRRVIIQLNIGILYCLQLLRDDLMDKDDRWQVEIWIKIIAGILNEPDEVYYDERDKLTAPADMQPYELESSDLNGKKRKNSLIVHVRSSDNVDDQQAPKKHAKRRRGPYCFRSQRTRIMTNTWSFWGTFS